MPPARQGSYKMLVRVVCGVAQKDQMLFLAQRGPGGKHAGLWEFPGGKVELGETDAQALTRELKEELGAEIRVGQQIAAVADAHILLIALEIDFLNAPRPIEAEQIKWHSLPVAEGLPMPPCDRKILETLQAPENRL